MVSKPLHSLVKIVIHNRVKKLGILLLAIIASFIISYDAYSGEWNYVEDPSSIEEFLPVNSLYVKSI